MEWFLNVPKIFHVYWGSNNLSYLRFLTVQSFMKQNPDWEVMLWHPMYRAEVVTWNTGELNYAKEWTNYNDKLMQLPIKKIPVDFAKYGLSNKISEVHKSDSLRFWMLSEYGGVWSDMDILYFQPITKLAVNKPKNSDKETFVCICHYGHSNGFFMAAKGSKFFKMMQKISIQELRPNKYQSNGVNACNKYFPTIESINKISPTVNIGMEAVYAHDGQHTKDIFSNIPPRFTDNSIGLHWYGGANIAGKFLRDTDGGLINIPDSIIGNVLKII